VLRQNSIVHNEVHPTVSPSNVTLLLAGRLLNPASSSLPHVADFNGIRHGWDLRDPQAHTILQGAVCEKCNNQWMSDIETTVGPIIRALSLGHSLSLKTTDAANLSTWTFKTLALYNITTNYRPLVALTDFRHVYRERTPPPGRHVELAYLSQAVPTTFTTRMSPIKFLLLPSNSNKQDIARRVDESSFVITMQIGKLLLQVAGLPSFGSWTRSDERRDDVLRIFAQIPDEFAWPPKHNFDGAIDSLNMSVGLRLLLDVPN
jgi:hypothetical protein